MSPYKVCRNFAIHMTMLKVPDLGQEHFCSPVERFRQGNFPREGGNRSHCHPLIVGEPIFINIFTSTISSQTLVHLLYSIFVSKPHIGICGLVVVLIKSCS
ncbi:hypothetical protein VPH35_079569 [Triticum aestivum]